MRLKAVSEIMLTLLLVGMSTLIFDIQQVESDSTILIVPDDYEKIQWAIGNASDGDTIFVKTGIYYEHVAINKSMSLIGENRSTTIIDGSLTGTVVYVTANNITISDFTIQNGSNGIVLSNSNGNKLFNNTVNSNTEDGIYLEYSNYNLICNNSLSRNKLSPYVAPNFKGNIHLCYSDYNNISNNEAILASKDIIGGYGSGILLEFSAFNRISHNEVGLNGGTGIYLRNSGSGSYDYNFIIGNNASFNNGDGIGLLNSQGNTILNNTANSNEMFGILLWGHDVWKQDNIVVGNTINLNEFDGIDVWDAGNNKIANNIIRSNKRDGMRLVWSNYNNITENLVSYNDCGIRTRYDANYNLVYHNNFVSNTIQAYCMEQQQRSWDNGYPSGGNYWSDHVCNGNPSDGTQPYTIDENNIDNYPFQDPNGWLPKLIVTSSPITGITFTINGTPQTTPYAEWLPEGSYNLEMPHTHNGYVWSHWLEDGDPNRIKTILLEGTTWTAVYEPAPKPVGGKATPIAIPVNKLELLAPYIGLTILLALTVSTLVCIKIRKRELK